MGNQGGEGSVLTAERARKRVLGLALGERSLLAAEVGAAARGTQVLRIAEFSFPAGVTLNDGEALGRALGEFLRSGGFECHHAVLGVPAKWLVLKPHTLPPCDSSTAVTMLTMHSQTHCPPELGDIVFDFAGQCDPNQSSSVLLMGLSRKWLAKLNALAAGAHLKMLSITPCAAALGAATARRVDSPLVLSLRPGAAELSAQEGLQTRFIRHLGSAVSAPLAMELRRLAATLPNGWGMGNGRAHLHVGQPRGLILWDDVGIEAEMIATLERALEMPVIRGELSVLGSNGHTLSQHRAGASAVALTHSALAGKRAAVDFLRPRLAPPRPAKFPPRVVWMSTAAVALAVAVAGGIADLAALQRQITRSDQKYASIQPRLSVAKPFVEQMRFAEAFREARPFHLSCLRDVTTALPPDGQTYLTGFHLQDASHGEPSIKGEFSGRSSSDLSVLNLAEKLRASGGFADLKTRFDAREAKANAAGVSFTVTFNYVPKL